MLLFGCVARVTVVDEEDEVPGEPVEIKVQPVLRARLAVLDYG